MSSNICKVKCEDKKVEIKIQRPSFKSVENGYVDISKFDINIYNARKQALYDELYNLAQSRGQNNEESHKFAEIESLWIVSIEFAKPRYKHIGGQVETLFNSNKRTYVNICALRISYALNHSTHPINTMDKQILKFPSSVFLFLLAYCYLLLKQNCSFQALLFCKKNLSRRG
ncbi:hypothetical protein [Campylobacter troglodytis]|uniref:hypothetical protein n=1 Tax=Campylobacter troglodytis TaxID=654363 RepID=UPI00115A0886|nr:hypothetical protein [Campylobacter troglodytis]TQR47934.1 hypothetical protein DMC01_13230 [Campylobacter troglodytis]